MSVKCKMCGTRIFDEDGQCFGVQLLSGVWVCDTADCSEFALGVVQAAREVVEFLDLCHREDAVDVAALWGMIDGKLREALG